MKHPRGITTIDAANAHDHVTKKLDKEHKERSTKEIQLASRDRYIKKITERHKYLPQELLDKMGEASSGGEVKRLLRDHLDGSEHG